MAISDPVGYGPRADRVAEAVLSDVRGGVRIRCSSEESLADRGGGTSLQAGATRDVPSVHAVVGDRDPRRGVGDTHPPMARGLEPRDIPRGIRVRGPGDVAELDLASRAVGVDVEGEGELEHPPRLVPLDNCLEVERPAVRREAGYLLDDGAVQLAQDPHSLAVDLQSRRPGSRNPHALVGGVEIPCIPLHRLVLEELELVSERVDVHDKHERTTGPPGRVYRALAG